MGENVPKLKDDTVYEEYKSRVRVWETATSVDEKKRAAKLIMSMEGNAERHALQLDIETLKTETGVKVLLQELDKLYLKDVTQSAFESIDDFINFKRTADTSMGDYCRAFRQRHARLQQKRNTTNPIFEDGVLAYYLLSQAGLSEDQKLLIRATTTKLTFDDMEAALKRTYGGGGLVKEEKKSPKIKEEQIEEEVFYNRGQQSSSYSSSYRGRGKGADTKNNHQQNNNQQNFYKQNSSRGRGAYGRGYQPDYAKYIAGLQCYHCQKFGHIAKRCPNLRRSEEERKTYLADNYESTDLNEALLDTGASTTVCGSAWLNHFKETDGEIEKIREKSKSFVWGNGKSSLSTGVFRILISICGKDVWVKTHVVEEKIPLLLSRKTMSRMGMILDTGNDEVKCFGGTTKMRVTESGHVTIPITDTTKILFVNSCKDPAKVADKLHRYFAHGSNTKILKFLEPVDLASEFKEAVGGELEKIKERCDYCLKNKSHQKSHRKVAMNLGTFFNDVVAMDLKKTIHRELDATHH